jgi:hypothetical protein
VSALAGQTVEVPFRGTGWVYLGEAASKRGLDYAARRLDGEGQTFLFRAVETGVYVLKFYRQDFIRDYIINDLVTVIVEEPPQAASLSSRSGAAPEQGTVSAEPRWPVVAARTAPETGSAPGTGSPAPAGQAGSTSRVRPETAASGAASTAASTGAGVSGAPPAAAGGVTVPGEAPSAEAASSPLLPQDTAAEEYMRRAREEYQGERFLQSAAILEQFLERFPLGSDEAYWLYAQISEKQGPSRNIRLALDYYHRLVAEYPQSGHYNDARRRIAWLERYYINIQ